MDERIRLLFQISVLLRKYIRSEAQGNPVSVIQLELEQSAEAEEVTRSLLELGVLSDPAVELERIESRREDLDKLALSSRSDYLDSQKQLMEVLEYHSRLLEKIVELLETIGQKG